MKVFLTWDGDHIGREVGRAREADDAVAVRRISQAIDTGNQIWRSWVEANGGSIISFGGDEGAAEVSAEKLSEIPRIRDQYAGAVGSTVSVGIGHKLSEADRALLAAKMRGGDRILLYTPEVETIIETETKKKGKVDEVDKLAEAYLNKSQGKLRAAAFMHKPSGKVYETGSYHNIEPWLKGGEANAETTGPHNSSDWESGFVTQEGKFLDREQALAHVEATGTLGRHPITGQERTQLDSADEVAGLRKDQPAENAGPNAGFGGAQQPGRPAKELSPDVEASEHSQGEAAASMMENQNPPPPEMTHAGQDSVDAEAALHAEAAKGEGQDQGQAQPAGDDQVKAQVVQALQALKAQAPVLEQIRGQAPDVYNAVMAMSQAVIQMARTMTGGDQQQEQGEAVQKSEEDLVKMGAMQRLAPFNPGKDGPGKDVRADVASWQNNKDAKNPKAKDVSYLRDEMPKMTGNMRSRALHKLAGATKTRRGPDGTLEFLLHRGMGAEERAESVKDGVVNHVLNRSSWTPRHDTASDFTNRYARGGKERGATVSAWVPEKHVDFVPKMLGAVQDDPEHGRENEFGDEHEVIVAPNHKSKLAAQKDLFPTSRVDANINRAAQTEGPFSDPSKKLTRVKARLARSEAKSETDWVKAPPKDGELDKGDLRDHPAFKSAMATRARIEELAATDRPSIWMHRHNPKGKAVVSKDPSKPGAWRVTHFDGETPTGHMEASSHAGALLAAHQSGADLNKPAPVDLDKASLVANAPPPEHHHLSLPVGSKIDPGPHSARNVGKIKVMHTDEQGQKEGWIQARAGMVLSQDGHAVSARNPKGK
jgi:hypothetical protein